MSRFRLGPVLLIAIALIALASSNASAFGVSGRVLDYDTGDPIPGAQVTIYLGATVVSQQITGANGDFSFDLASGNYTIEARAGGYETDKRPLVVKENVSMDIKLKGRPAPSEGGSLGMVSPIFFVTALLLIIVIVSVLMFSRIVGRKAIEHQRRSTLLDHIKSNPGTHFREMSRTFCMREGALTHHLSVLEREGFVQSKMYAGKRIYYPAESRSLPKDVRERIIDCVASSPGITQTELARTLGISRMLVHYHVRKLLKDEVLIEKDKGLHPRPGLGP
jgi:DNA-binding MarR family transcriptional regulator